jgi:hypothetical protein
MRRLVGYRMKIEGRRWHFEAVDNLTVEERGEAGHAISLALIDPPRPPAELRDVAVRAILNLYSGSKSYRAKELERRYRDYLASGWPRERDLETLPYPRSTERALLHRLARLNEGASLCWRRIFDIAGRRC